MAFNSELYQQRLHESRTEKEMWTTVYPIFFYNQILLPNNKLNLHLFEPRYKIMMSRVVNSNRAFAYVNVSGNRLAPGDIALVAEVKEAEFLADGRCMVEAHLCKRSRIVEHYIEDGTQGLHYCRLEPLRDDAIEGHTEELNNLKDAALLLIDELLNDDYSRRVVNEQYCVMPTEDVEAFSMWLCCVSPLTSQDTYMVLHSRNTADRMRKCIQRLEVYLEQRRNPRVFPIVSALGSSLASTISAFLGTSPAPRFSSTSDTADNIASTGDLHGVEEGVPPDNQDSSRREETAIESDSDSVPSLVSDSDDSSSSSISDVSHGAS